MAHIQRLSLTGLRNLSNIDASIQGKYIVISGGNGAGKTAILEGIYLLATGRSFRESRLQRCQQWQATHLTVLADIHNQQGLQHLAWQRHKQETQIKCNREWANSQAELAWHCPVQLFSPESQDLITHGPQERRRFLDWGAFYHQPTFLPAWRQYQHALKQRNAALRQGLADVMVNSWNAPLSHAADIVDAARQHYSQQLTTQVKQLSPQISDSLSNLELSYHRGWTDDLLAHWQAQLENDRQLGYTQTGPHRADLKLKLNGRDALAVCSRGQQKLLALTLLLSQAIVLANDRQETPILLLDDLPAELDQPHLAKLLDLLSTLNAQCWLTTTQASLLPWSQDHHDWRLNTGQLQIA